TAGREEGDLLPETMARLDGFSALAAEIMMLSAKRMAALARGRDVVRRDRVRLGDLLARASAEIGLLRLHPGRIADLIALLQDGHRHLDGIEREAKALAASAAALRRELPAFAQRLGLPIEAFREVVARVRQAQRDAKRAREAMVRAHLPLVVAIAK